MKNKTLIRSRFSCKHENDNGGCSRSNSSCTYTTYCEQTTLNTLYPCKICKHKLLGDGVCKSCVFYDRKINFEYND